MFPIFVVIGLAGASAAAGAAGAPADSLHAALPVYEVPPIRVEAERAASLDPLFAPREILTREALARRDASDLAWAIAPMAGLRVSTGADGVSAFAALRGLGPDRTAVLLDGRPIGAAQGGAVNLRGLDPEGLERVEVMRGAVGALAGPDALGGAINLVRRRDRRPSLTLRAQGGSGERALARARLALVRGRWDGDAVLSGETAAPALGALRSELRAWSGRARITHRPAWAGYLELAGERRGSERELPGSHAFPTPGASMRDGVRDGSAALRGLVLPFGLLDADVGYREQERIYREPNAPLGAVHDRHVNRALRARTAWRLVDEGGGGMSVIAEGARDALDSTTDGAPERLRGAVGAETTRAGARWGISGALRMDALQRHGAHASGRIAVTRLLARGPGDVPVTARFGTGTSFRPPTFDDLFWPARATAAGNPSLRPERSFDVDLGLDGTGHGWRGQISVFHQRVRHLIQWTPGADGVWRPHNVGEVRVIGIECGAEIERRVGTVPVRTRVSYSGTDARDAGEDPVTGGKRLVARPAHRLFVETEAELGAWRAALGAEAVDRMPLTAANTKWHAGRATVHARLGVAIARTLRLDLEGRNLGDVRFEDVRGYPAPGREVLFGVRYSVESER